MSVVVLHLALRCKLTRQSGFDDDNAHDIVRAHIRLSVESASELVGG